MSSMMSDANLPIVGQPFIIRTWYPTVVLNCSCDSKHALLLSGVGSRTTCPDCGSTAMLQGVGVAPNGNIAIGVAKVIETKKEGQ